MMRFLFLKLNQRSRILVLSLTTAYTIHTISGKKKLIECELDKINSRTTKTSRQRTSYDSHNLNKHECDLSWVKESLTAKARCWIHHNNDSQSKNSSGFDPTDSDYFEIQMLPQTSINLSNAITEKENTESAANIEHNSKKVNNLPILHNTVLVLPNLLSKEECEFIVRDAESIIDNSKGVKTEKWALYSNFNKECQTIISRLLTNHVLTFMELRLPGITKQLFQHQSTANNNDGVLPKGMPMEFYWDDPVVIKYKEGNKLAPHEDMRDLTIVVPLNPLDDFRLIGGGTRFWPDMTSDCAVDNDKGGVLLRPSPGSGIIFNGDIVHSGESVIQGTRFVLMTSINLDDIV